MTLNSTVEGRVLYRLAEEGEVLGSGGKVLTLVNLGDVYMEIYLPAQDAVKAKLGADARIVLDIAPEYARTREGDVRRPGGPVHAQAGRDPERARQADVPREAERPARAQSWPYIERIKTGIRGVGYVRLDDSAAWPERLDRPFPGLTPAGRPRRPENRRAAQRRRGPSGPPPRRPETPASRP